MRTFQWMLIILIGAIAFGCKEDQSKSGGPTTKSGGSSITVGFSQSGQENSWRTAETKSMESEAEARGIKLQYSDGQGKQENQIKALRGFVAQKVDAIILAPLIETGWEPILIDIKAAKIPVILVDRGVTVDDQSLYSTLIASDFVEEGRMAAEWLAKKMNGKASMAELEGLAGSAPANDRAKGFAAEIAKHPDMKIVISARGDFRRDKGKEAMEAFLKGTPGINAVYAHNDEMALGAIQAIEAAGKRPGTDIIIVSIDGVKDAFDAMVAGKLNCTVECNPLLGPAAFDAVQKSLKGETLPKKTIVKDELFDQSVAKDVIGGRKY